MATAAELRAQSMAAQQAAAEAAQRAAELATKAEQAEREERKAKAKRESEEHYRRMFTEIGQPLAGLNEAQHGVIYAQAYQQGHAYGFSEVEGYYGELAEMARKLIEAAD